MLEIQHFPRQACLSRACLSMDYEIPQSGIMEGRVENGAKICAEKRENEHNI